MNRVQKEELASTLREKFLKANAMFITEYRGMSVGLLDDLRKKVRQGDGELKVLQNRIAKIAAKGTAFEAVSKNFTGPLAVALSYKDPVGVAKAVLGAIADESPFKVRLGTLEGKELSVKDVEALSKLPDRKTLLAMTLSVMQGPIRNFACVMAAVPRDFANVLNAVKDKKASQQ
jgi:large subunit ribosomal protein L10